LSLTGELRHGRRSAVADPFTLQDADNGERQDLHVQKETLVVNIPHIKLELSRPINGVAPVHLRPTGYPRMHLVTTSLGDGVTRNVFRKEWTRADQRHVAAQDIQEFRQLVEARRAKEAAKAREPQIVRTRFVFHRTKLDDVEETIVLAGTALPEE